MAKYAVLAFDQALERLFRDRTHWLRTRIRKPRPGKPPSFDKAKVDRQISRLQALAEECQLYDHAMRGIGDLHDLKKQWHITKRKGWGVHQKCKAFVSWFGTNIPYDNCVYVFWARGRCRYVGWTLGGKKRPQSQFEKYWFPGVTRVDIYASRRARDVPKLECLLTHGFRPKHSKVKPAARKWYSKCPICETRKLIRNEVKSIFRLR